MKKFVAFLFLILLLGVAGGVVFLGTWELPPPTSTVEKTLSNDRLQR